MAIENLKNEITKLDINNQEHLEIYCEYKNGTDLTSSQCARETLEKLNENRRYKLNQLILNKMF